MAGMTCALPWAVAVCWVGCALSAAQASAPAPDVATRLKNSLASHPRLLLGAGEEKSINDRAAHDPRLGQLRDYVIAEADWMLTQPPLERKLTGRRLLSVSRAAVQRIGTLALAYRLTGEARFADGARECMKSVCAFSDFNPSHFLDVAEMTAALAVGYDWLFDVLPADEKAAVRNAILNKSLTLDVSKEGWVRGGNNWNQVCHGGLTMGALAIADEEPGACRARHPARDRERADRHAGLRARRGISRRRELLGVRDADIARFSSIRWSRH